MLRIFIAALLVLASGADVAGQAPASLPPYRYRLLGVFNGQTGEAIEGAEVSDVLQHTTALTTKTGTVTLVFLPDGGSLVRIQKMGYRPNTMMVAISPADTVPLTVLLTPTVQLLPTVVTKDSAPRYMSPGLQEFEERRRQGFGHFITDEELRKSEHRTMTNVVRSLPGLHINCAVNSGACWAASRRLNGKFALLPGDCPVDVYIDGAASVDNDLEKIKVNDYAGIEFYAGAASIPVQYNRTGSSCGVLLFWTRER